MKRNLSHCRLPMSVFLIALQLLFVSCSSWKQTSTLTDPAAREEPPTRLRAELVDGGVLTLHDPWFGGDTLYGRTEAWVGKSDGGYAIGDTAAVPITRIAKVEAWRFDGAMTALLVVGIGASVVLVAAVLYLTTYEATNCPRIHSWDGTAWRLDSGTFAGAIMPALARTDVDNLDFARSQDGILRLRVTGLPNETEHVDAIRLLAVDHDPQCTIAPDASGVLHALGPLTRPTAARDFRRRDMLPLIRENDAMSWESVPTGRDTARAEDIRDGLEIEFPRAAGATEARLVVDGRYTTWADFLLGEFHQLRGRDTGAWYRALAADPEQAHDFAAAMAREVSLEISIWDGAGWRRQGFLPGAGPELAKRQVVQLDLSAVRGETVRVRLESAPSLWLIDRVAIDLAPERGFVTKEIGPSDARDSRGLDVRSQLDRPDGKALVMESPDSVELRFAVDPTPPGRARSYLAATTGWYRIHVSETADPNRALADRLIREPRALSRLSVARINEALQSMAAGR